MKRFFLLFLAAVLLIGCAAADPVDLSGMSFDELIALRDQMNLAIWNSQEWQEVTVPAGIWRVGADIPAGHWSIRVAGDCDVILVSYFDKLDDAGLSVGSGAYLFYQTIATPGLSGFGEVNAETVDIEMQDGWFFKCDGTVVFSPYAGKPDLGFK